ncbi:unnamed protein product [Bursaphelenchus xylophilus]|uniref:(pine wood nematode) hypothetical protein n=1 Tax=Bursaphelenchus xylophilus TaxID=6326 RepID=A0A1I7S697_BURXY|nr:unnamed protein product [Bursaphelenchus xylophilus]CAG9128220.1 unnamed protein product [Bursaphelenchus xylophilus]
MAKFCAFGLFVLLIEAFHNVKANECHHAFAENANKELCSSPNDCSNPTADCIFSIKAGKRVCCAEKKGAVLPVCPNGRQLFLGGRNPASSIVCASPDEEDRCPDGYTCTESATNFDKVHGQSNSVCCSE